MSIDLSLSNKAINGEKIWYKQALLHLFSEVGDRR